MADITVTVTSPGLQAYGSSTFGAESFGGLEPSASSSTGTLSVEANANVSVTGISLSNQIGTTSQAFSSTILADSQLLTTNIGQGSGLANADVSVTGNSIASNINSVTVDGELQVGWGGDAWGENDWGDLSGAYANPTGISLSANIGSIITEADADVSVTGIALTGAITDVYAFTNIIQEVTGISANILIGNESTGFGVDVTGSEINTGISSVTIDDRYLIGEGWGRDVWGGWAWGVNYSVLIANGLTLTAVTGNEDAFTDVVVSVSGNEAQTFITPVGTSANSDNEIAHSFLIQGSLGDVSLVGHALVEPTGIGSSIIQGQTIGGTIQEVPVTGSGLTTFIGNEDTAANADVSVTGSSITGSVGQAGYIAGFDVTGVSATFNLGSVTILGNARVNVTGTGLTTAVASPNIIAWAEVSTGTPVTWREVDLAA